MRSALKYVWMFGIACSKPAPPVAAPTPTSPALNKLMNEHINPAFSRMSFLAFHADDQDDPDAARQELASTAQSFAAAAAKVAAWPDPPVTSEQAREVFQTYAATFARDARSLADTPSKAPALLEQIATTCNNCHHFFRLKIKDSVVGH